MIILSVKNNLPKGWVRTTIDRICITKSGGTPSRRNQEYFGGKIPWIKSGELNDSVIFECEETISKLGLEKSNAILYPKNTLLMAMYGVTIGKLAILGFTASTNQAICALSHTEKIVTNLYLFWFLRSIRNDLLGIGFGGAQKNISQEKIKRILIPIPPYSEQKRIVSKIESIFAQIDAAKEKLEVLASQTKLASGSLSMLRSSVLKQAFEGKLVPQDPKDESASVLLEKIRKENPNLKQSDYEEIEQENLPEGWFAVQFHFITKNFDHQRIPVSKNKRREMQGNIPYYGASGVIDHVNRSIFDGDYLLIGEDGANLLARTTPIAFIAKGKFWINNHAHILKTLGNIPLEFLTSYINSINLAPWVTGTAQPKLNQSNLNKIPIPIPSLSEQKRIVSKIESIFAKIDVVHEIVQSELKKLDRLRQSVLKQAFEGKLVPQDPNDEHANILLKRIKKERIEQKEVKRGIKNVK